MPLRLIIKMLVVVVIVSLALLYYLPLMNGKPPFYGISQMLSNISSRLRDSSQAVSSKISNTIPDMPASTQPTASKPVTIYRWQDTQGQWHFSNTPPGHGQPYEIQRIDPATNLVQSVPLSQAKPVDGGQPESQPQAGEPGSNPYSARSIKNLMDKSNAIRDQMNSRNAQLDQLMEQGH